LNGRDELSTTPSDSITRLFVLVLVVVVVVLVLEFGRAE
jgi:hypothetical protein